MDNDLKKHLNVLNSERCLKKPREASVVIDKIIECLSHKQSQFSIGLFIGMILDDNAIFTFIWKASTTLESIPSVTAAFKLLDFLITSFEKCTQPYFPVLFEKCLHLMDTKFAKIKEVSLKLLRKLIVADSKNCLELSKLMVKFEKYLKEESKIPGTVAEQLFSLLGYVFEKYPEVVQNGSWFLQKILENLRKDITVLKASSLTRQKGAFEAINGYLTNFTMSDVDCERIYEYIKSVSKFRPEKRIVGRAALKIVQNHWRYFSEKMYNDRFFWRMNMAVWIKQNSEDRLCAFGVLQAFYSVVALFVKQGKDPVDEFVKEFCETLNTEGNNHEKCAALMGFKLFTLTDCLGNDFREVYTVVMNFVREHENIDAYLPSCIECVAAFVLKSGVRELSCLERLSVKVINNYPKFECNSNVLTALEKSFYMIGLSNLETLLGHIRRVLYQGLLITCSAMTQREYDILKESGSTPDAYTYKYYLSLWRYMLDLMNSHILPIGGSVGLKKGVAVKVFDSFMQSFLQIISKLNYTMNGSDVGNASDVRIFINCVDLYEDLMQENDQVQKWANTVLREVISLSYKNPLVAGFYKIVTKTLRVADCECDILDKYLEGVLLKVDLYKGELQLACLRTILASPVNLIERYLDKVIPAIEVALQIGRGCFPLLKNVIEELESWNRQLPPSIMEKLMQKILPHFDIFFQSQHFRGNDLVDYSIVGKKLKNKIVFNDSELLALQKKFLLFVGELDINKSVHLIQLPDTERDITDKRLIYHIPLLNGKTDLDLDELLPRVIDLAVSCSDRNTRITACELLYSIIMIILGNINQLSGGYGSVFRKITKVSIPLACDSDEIVCQIYEPLMYQIMHYFSSKKALNFTETNDLIDILMDYVTKPYDPAVRDFSAILLREFIEWTIKQHTPEELKTTPEIIKRILRKIYSLALHPSFNKRQGAAVVFNKVYTILREEEFILCEYWFELFYYFMESLRMCDGPEDVNEIINAIQHIKRPLTERHAEFNEPGNRRSPPEFNGPLLGDLVKWTADRCDDVKTHTRKIAMRLVEELAPLVKGCSKIADIYSKEPELKIPLLKSNPTEEDYINWLKTQTALFEYMAWLSENQIIPSEVVFRTQTEVITNFAKGIVEPKGIEQESVLAFLNLLFVLYERAFYFPIDFWDVVRMCMFNPVQLGFDMNNSFATEELSQILSKLISHLYHKLPVYYCNYFYDSLESVIIAPVFKHLIKNRQIETSSWEFLFSLRITQAAGFWNVFSLRFPFTGIVKAIFKSLFHKQGQMVYAVMMEPTCKRYFMELLKLFLDEKDIIECLDDETEVIEEETGKSVKKGLYFWLTFKEVLYGSLKAKLLINREEKGFGILLDAIENSKETAKDILMSWDDVLTKFPNKGKVLKIALAIGKGIKAPGCLKSTPVADIIIDVDKSHVEVVLKLLPYLSEAGEEYNDALRVCLSKIDESKNFITSLLQSLKQTGSLVLLRFILSNAAWFKDSEREDIESALEGFNALAVTHSSKALRLVYSFCFDDLPSNASISNIHKLFFQPMMKKFNNKAVYEFMVDSLVSLGDVLSTPWSAEDLNSAKPNIMRKICAADLLKIFVTKQTKEELNSMPLGKRQLMDSTVKKGFFLLKQPVPPKVLKERHRKLMCEMFNMICCVISARCVEEKFYKLFIFDERGSFLFKAIDETAVYSLSMEFDEIPKRSRHKTIIRRAADTPRKYAQTDTLFTSSLREDVTQFDLTYASIQPQTTEMIELEMDTLNSHECMPVLIATISKMVRDVQHPPDKIPCWLKFFLHILNSELPDNHKLFTLKAMYNVQDYLKPYCGIVFPIVLDSTSLFANYQVNYFLIDVIEMMLTWEKVPVEEKSRMQLTELVVMLIEKCDSFRRDIVKNNVEVIKSMIETWKDSLYLEKLSSTVFERLQSASSGKNGVTGGFDGFVFVSLHTAGILLANDIPAWKSNRMKEFFKIILSHFQEENKSKELYAEICGMALSYLKRKNENVDMYAAVVRGIIEEISLGWFTLLYNVHKHYPEMASSFVFKIFSSAWNGTDSLILNKLEMLLSHASESEIDCTFLRHADGFLIDLLNSVDAVVQEISLQIVFKMLDKFTEDKFVLKEALRLQNSMHTGVRKWVYEIARKMFRKYPDECRVVLLRGLNESGELKQPCLDFWKSMEITNPVEVFKQMYAPATEEVFLSNAVQILLHNAGGQYEMYIFQNPIIEGRYQKRELSRGTLHLHTNQSVEFTATARNIQYLRPSVPLSFEPTVQTSSHKVPDVTHTIPRNPYKKRFRKNYVKFTKQEKVIQKLGVNIYGEYADGDYPDIKIRHEQMLRLLEALSERDHHIARLLLVSLYNGMISEDRCDFFEDVLKTSTSFHPAVIGFVLQVVYKRGLRIDCELISNAAISSNWLSLGALIIEDAISQDDVDESSPKKPRGVETLEEIRWLELAKLYRNLEENDVLTGIFLDKLTVREDVRCAVQAEGSLDYQTASNHYEVILQSYPECHQTEFFTESYFNCLAKLSNWSLLNLCIRSTVTDMDDLWKNYNLLSWFLRSEMMITLGSDKNEYKTLIDDFCQNKAKLSVLESNFGEELTVYDWLSGRLQKACYRIDRLCLEFLSSWSHIDQWAYNLRLSKLGSLQTLSELNHSLRALVDEKSQPHWDSMPSLDDDLSIWDVRLAYRREFFKQKDLTAIGVKAHLELAKAALAQGNLNLTKECMTKTNPQLAPELKEEYDYCFNIGRMFLARRKMIEVTVGLEMYKNIFRGLLKEIQTDLDRNSNLTMYNFLVLGQLISEVSAVLEREDISPDIVHWLVGETKEDNIAETLKKQGLEYLESAKSIAEKLDAPIHSKSDIYGRLIKYLLQTESENEKLGRYILKAMSLGNKEARELFGVVIQKEIPFAESESDEVPSWMFIMWINQILAAINSKLFSLLKSIILRIASDYPNAIRFSYRSISKSKNPKVKLLSSRLDQMLSDQLYNDFLISVSYLAPPDVILRRYLEYALQNDPQSVLSNLCKVMFSPEGEKFRGVVFKYWDGFKNPLENMMKENNLEVIKEKIQTLLNNLQKPPSKRVNLESYSPWLYNFHSIRSTGELELPGQYGNSQPVKNPITITSFRSDILTFDTKCQPTRITILGNDAKEYKYLIKFGEDLRQDERVQQLFSHFNHRLAQSKRTKRYHINTYKILPLNDHYGMIQWIDNHVSLYDMITTSLKDPNQIAKSQNAHLERIEATFPIQAHLIAYDTIKREASITNFNARVHDFPKDLMKQSFVRLSTSPEQFVYLRGNFATSYAVMSITHWLIGIGDRHLQNTLVSTKTGHTLGIDFGYAFGFGTHLTPPELIPFRLTPQILNLMHPFKDSGWIKQTMIHSLRVFRKEDSGLSAIMEVFIREPVIDWLKQARKSERCNVDEAWNPKERIAIVERKLKGANPVAVVEADLRLGHSQNIYLEKFVEVLKGVEQENIRARLGADDLTEEEQVDCLIDLATDAHVLGKTYVGWNPWL